jgi:hypothetical protein
LLFDPEDITPAETLRLAESMRTCLEANADVVEGGREERRFSNVFQQIQRLRQRDGGE